MLLPFARVTWLTPELFAARPLRDVTLASVEVGLKGPIGQFRKMSSLRSHE